MKNYGNKAAMAAITAALYAVLTLALAPISYGPVQCRISEALNLLAFFDPMYAVGVTLGCLISNLYSPFGVMDIVFGTLATGLAAFAITRTKNSLFLASLWPTASMVIVAAEVSYASGVPFGMPYVYNILQFMAGEFIAVSVIGYALFRILLMNRTIRAFLKYGPSK